MALISTENLTRRFGGLVAVDSLTLEVEPGVVGLVGANGAGKSTLIKLLLGLLEPSAGSARVLDTDVTSGDPGVRARIGYMPEHDCLPHDMSATEFVVHMARMSGLPRTAARERAADTLRHVGLHEERYRSIGDYSTGMRQRVKLAQALVHDPQLVLLDEPTSGLDPAGRQEMLDLVARIHADFDISVLVSSHLLGELEQVCDSIIVIEAGRLTRHSATAAMTQAMPIATIELDVDAAPLAQRLADRGLTARAAGRSVDVELADDDTYDLLRDEIVALDAGLVRLEQRRHRMSELFAEQGEVAAHVD